jgi:hypothetical protein
MNKDTLTTIFGCIAGAATAAAPLLHAYPPYALASSILAAISMAIWGKLTNKA